MNQKMDYLTFIRAGIRNKPGRNLATAFCFAFIAANIFSGQYLMAAAAESVGQGVLRMGADLIVVPAQYQVFLRGSGPNNTFAIVKAEPSAFRLNTNIMDKFKNDPGIAQMSPQLYVFTLNVPELSSSPVDIFGIDPSTDFTIRPWLHHPLGKPLGEGEVIAGHEITGDISSQVSVFGHMYTIAGRLDPTQSAIDRTIFMRLDDAYILAAAGDIAPRSATRISKGDVNAVLVKVKTGEDPDVVAARISRAFSPAHVTVIARHFSLDPVSRGVAELPGFLNIISAVVVTAALPLIALIASMVAHERQREIGLLRSMGATRKVIFLLVFAESLVLAAVGGMAGIGASLTALSFVNMQGFLNSALQVSFRMPTASDIGLIAGMALFVVIAIGSIASLYPAYKSSTLNPYDAIRSEE